jgi:hypothetical protein
MNLTGRERSVELTISILFELDDFRLFEAFDWLKHLPRFL